MSNTDDNQQKQPFASGGNSLTAILAALQQGVQAINNLTQTLKVNFPSS